MALRLEYFVVAEGVAVDQLTNQVSLFNVLEEIKAPAFPALVHKAVAHGLWVIQNDLDIGTEHQVLLIIRLPDRAEHRLTTNFTVTHRRHRVTQLIEGIPLSTEGTLEFEVLLDGQHAARHLVDVERPPAIDGQAPTAT